MSDLRTALERISNSYDSNDECRWCDSMYGDDHSPDCAADIANAALASREERPGLDAERLWNAMYDANRSHGGYECCAPPTHANAEEIAAEYNQLAAPATDTPEAET